MITRVTDFISMNESGQCDMQHLVEVSGMTVQDLDDLVMNDIIRPIDLGTVPHQFSLQHVLTVRVARRLKDDFQLDRNGLAMALTLLQRIEALELELVAVRAQR